MKIRARKNERFVFLISLVLFSGLIFSTCNNPRPTKIEPNWPDRSGTYEYSAFYEEGSKAGTQTHGHQFKLSLENGAYVLDWGGVRVTGVQIADGLIYKWSSGRFSGQGIYVLYDNATKLFGTFRLIDSDGEQRGFTRGAKKNPSLSPDQDAVQIPIQ
jgi:hypothetical protein